MISTPPAMIQPISQTARAVPSEDFRVSNASAHEYSSTPSSQLLHPQWQLASDRLDTLRKRKDNWDSHDSMAPISELIDLTQYWLWSMFQRAVERHRTDWVSPNISSNEVGEVVLEWWHKNKDVTLFVRQNGTLDYLKSWGSDIEEEMEDGKVESMDTITTLSQWLYSR